MIELMRMVGGSNMFEAIVAEPNSAEEAKL